MSRITISACVGLLVLVTASSARAANWPSWRGPNGDGHSGEKDLPVRWSAESVVRTISLPGSGQSSPVVWGDRVFLTASTGRGRERVVFCVDRRTGKILWQKTAWTGEPERSHKMNGWASATCATDGEHVYAFFGRGGGLFCFSVDGELVWKKDLGEFAGPWGTAAAPVLFGDLVIQNCDADRDAYIIGLNKKTGRQVWRTTRDDYRGWSTPIVIEAGGRKELVVNGHSGVRAYNPATGKQLWSVTHSKGRGTPTVTPGENGLLYVVEGRPAPIYAIRPGGNGNVTNSHVAWKSPRKAGRDLPSPIVIGRYLLVMGMRGILTCHDCKSGKELHKVRIGGNFSAAPVAWFGKAFFISETGETVVIEPGPKLKIVARNRLERTGDEIFRASIVPADGQLLIRSTANLYQIGKQQVATR